MKKQQVILVGSGILVLVLLYAFGITVPSKKAVINQGSTVHNAESFDIQIVLAAEKDKLTPAQQVYINSLESAVVRGDVKNQQIHTFHQIANFWKDSIRHSALHAHYTAEASKLENSEKSLTFAAQLFLDNLRGAGDPSLKAWMSDQAKDLFERSLRINPLNDSAKIGLGSAYIFGTGMEDPQEAMKGIQHILEVARRDSTNMYAQLMLGVGGVVSGQLDKAIERLLKVVSHQPNHLEALLTLAEAYERKGDNANAVKWYTRSKALIGNPEVVNEIEQRINKLK